MAETAVAFQRLHPHLQHALVQELGWRSLRPVQEQAIDAILDDCNTVVLAPTAGGKTEAAIFPVLSRILFERSAPVAALYVCPIRALLNNQEDRIGQYARMVGLDAFKWHGDVADSKKNRYRREPGHILMTTPESLEVMLISERTDARQLFAGLGAVVVDEIHAFAGDDRGAHLVSLLERLSRFCDRDLQRIGLSATVGNPEEIGRWLQGSSRRAFRLVDPPRPPAARDQRVEFFSNVDDAAPAIASITRGKKSLVFAESRAQAEKVTRSLAGRGVEVFVHHSSVSRADRALAEDRFARGENTAIVCTSTLELGIDVGDLDQVIQVDAPSSVASYLQRLGRTGRRAGSRTNCTFFCLSSESLLQVTALLRLASKGWVESVKPSRRAMHVLAHQIMALALQEGGLSRHHVLAWLSSAFPFSELTGDDVSDLVNTMVEREILHEGDGLLSLGSRGETTYGRRNFFELYAVFSAPPVLRVLAGRQEIGHVQASFIQGHRFEEGPMLFRLAGRSWQVLEVEWGRGTVSVQPAEQGRVPSWLGQPSMLSFELCQEIRRSLSEPGPEDEWLSAPARVEIEGLRAGYEPILRGASAPIEDQGDKVQWHTFAGAGINRLLAAALGQQTGEKWVAGNLSLKGKTSGMVEARQAVRALAAIEWPKLAGEAARGLVRGRISKFQPCLPADAETQLLAERLLDVEGTKDFLSRVKSEEWVSPSLNS